MNLKEVVNEPEQNSFSLQSVTTRTGFANVDPIFYKVHSLSSEFRVQCIDFISEKVTIFRGFLSTIRLTATRLCKAHGRLVFQMQGLSFFWGSSTSDFYTKLAVRKH